MGGCPSQQRQEPALWEAIRSHVSQTRKGGTSTQGCICLQSQQIQSGSPKLSPETFSAFHISAMEQLTEDTYRVRFATPGNSQLGLRPGQHLVLRGEVDGLEIQRACTPISPDNAEGHFYTPISPDNAEGHFYTPISPADAEGHFYTPISPDNAEGHFYTPISPAGAEGHFYTPISPDNAEGHFYTPISPDNAEGHFDVLIKCYPTGLMSRTWWRPGDTASWRGPFGSFLHEPNKCGELLMVAAGTGLAPVVSILQGITDYADDETFVTLVCCFKTSGGIYLKTFLPEPARFWSVRTFFVPSQETSSSSSEQLPWSLAAWAGSWLKSCGAAVGEAVRTAPAKAPARGHRESRPESEDVEFNPALGGRGGRIAASSRPA